MLLAYLESVDWRLVSTWGLGVGTAGVLLAFGLPLVVAAVVLVLLTVLSCLGAFRDHLAVRRSLGAGPAVRARRSRRAHRVRRPGRMRRELARRRPGRSVRRARR